MNRSEAREAVILLGFASAITGVPAPSEIDEFFTADRFAALAEDNAIFNQLPNEKQMAFIHQLLTSLEDNRSVIDQVIADYSQGWSVNRISKTALSILRCAICEILFFEDIPSSVSINEAVEIAKKYDDEKTVAFINGLLGNFVREKTN